jgi:hypothetical protein
MARITPSNGSPLDNPIDIGKVRNLQGYRAILIRTDWTTGAAQYGSQPRLVLDWQFPDVDGGQVRDYAGLALGVTRGGEIAQLRRILNAIAGVPAETEVSFFDDESLEWGYEGVDGPAWGALEPGWEIVMHGEIKPRQDRQGSFFNPTHYYPAGQPGTTAAPVAAAPAPAPQPAPAAAAAPSNRPGNQPPAAGNGEPFNPQPVPRSRPRNTPQPQATGSYSEVAPGAASSDEVPF